MMQHFVAFTLVLLAATASVRFNKLTRGGGIAGALCALLVYAGGGWTGLAMLAAFFVMGVVATRTGIREKRKKHLVPHDASMRNAAQVWANGGVAAACGLIHLVVPSPMLLIGMAGALSAAAADTLSSELGNAWGRHYIDLRTMRSSAPGPDGVISSTGLLCGLAGSFIIAAIYKYGYDTGIASALIVVIAGTAGNLADSLAGAFWERKGWLSNDAVNLLNTAVGASAAFAALCW